MTTLKTVMIALKSEIANSRYLSEINDRDIVIHDSGSLDSIKFDTQRNCSVAISPSKTPIAQTPRMGGIVQLTFSLNVYFIFKKTILRTVNGVSDFYDIERNIIKTINYTNLKSVVDNNPSGNIVSINELSTTESDNLLIRELAVAFIKREVL